jgi:two-component system sensor histidine kinase UhpB
LSPGDAARAELPRALVLALYRISQEALTNVARHAGASSATLRLRAIRAGGSASMSAIDWSVCDDGVGLDDPSAALRRGNGLAGIRERVWAHGGDLQLAAVHPGSARPGLCLQARQRVDVSGAASRPEVEAAS